MCGTPLEWRAVGAARAGACQAQDRGSCAAAAAPPRPLNDACMRPQSTKVHQPGNAVLGRPAMTHFWHGQQEGPACMKGWKRAPAEWRAGCAARAARGARAGLHRSSTTQAVRIASAGMCMCRSSTAQAVCTASTGVPRSSAAQSLTHSGASLGMRWRRQRPDGQRHLNHV